MNLKCMININMCQHAIQLTTRIASSDEPDFNSILNNCNHSACSVDECTLMYAPTALPSIATAYVHRPLFWSAETVREH